MEETIIAELKSLIEHDDSSAFSLLNKASQLAEITDSKDFKLLFDYHIKGMTKADTIALSQTNAMPLFCLKMVAKNLVTFMVYLNSDSQKTILNRSLRT